MNTNKKVIWYVAPNGWEVYFPWEFRGIGSLFMQDMYKWWGPATSRIIVKEWSEKEIEDARANEAQVKRHFNNL